MFDIVGRVEGGAGQVTLYLDATVCLVCEKAAKAHICPKTFAMIFRYNVKPMKVITPMGTLGTNID